MKTTHILSAALLAALSLTSCSDDEPGSISGSDVEISATIGSTTRTAPYAQGEAANTFAEGDEIYVETSFQSGRYAFGSGSWTFAGGERIKWMEPSMEFRACYPATAHEGTFTLPTDQSSMQGLCSADYMTYTGTHHNSSGAVRFAMERQTARVAVETILSDDLQELGITVSSVILNADTDPGVSESQDAIKTFFRDGLHIAIAAPTVDGAASLDIVLRHADNTEKTVSLSGIPALEKGMSHNLRVKIGRGYVKLENLSIKPWTEAPETGIDVSSRRLISLSQPGTLTSDAIAAHLGIDDMLCIEGKMNGSDFKVLREFMGCRYDVNEASSQSVVHHLDLGGVKIMPGGSSYAGEPESSATVADVVPAHLFHNLVSDAPVHITLPGTACEIGTMAFCNAESISSVLLPDNLSSIGSSSFSNTGIENIIIPAGVRKIGQGAFSSCLRLKGLDIPGGVTTLGADIVSGCTGLEKLSVPSSVTDGASQTIPVSALTELRVMAGPSAMGTGKFKFTDASGNTVSGSLDCDLYLCEERQGEVTGGNIWNGIRWRSINLLNYCYVEQPGMLTDEMITRALNGGGKLIMRGIMNKSDFDVLHNYLANSNDIHYIDMRKVKSVYALGDYNSDVLPGDAFYMISPDVPLRIELPEGLRAINSGSFAGANIDYIELPDKVEYLSHSVFYESQVKEIVLPGSLRFIEPYCFYNCTNLRRLHIPEGVTHIGVSFAESSRNLEYLYMPYSITDAVFGSVSSFINHRISADNLKTLKIMTKPDVLPLENIWLFVNEEIFTGSLDCDLYLCDERKNEVTGGNIWNGITWRSITFVDGSTLK